MLKKLKRPVRNLDQTYIFIQDNHRTRAEHAAGLRHRNKVHGAVYPVFGQNGCRNTARDDRL